MIESLSTVRGLMLYMRPAVLDGVLGRGRYEIDRERLIGIIDDRFEEVPAVEDALKQLAQMDRRQARIAALRYYGGLTSDEVAAVLGVSRTTVTREWETAKMWLRRALEDRKSRGGDPPSRPDRRRDTTADG
jgi:DNA-directed RNA polymerase specialized sigma24 family protein